MEYHPYSEIWPLMDGEDFNKFKVDIAANGLHVDVITYQGKVLDGRNRERACQETGVPVRYAAANVRNDSEALDLVVSLNEHRRHLSLEQRAFAAAKLSNLKLGSNRYAEKKVDFAPAKSTSNTTTTRQAAARIGVSYGSAVRAKAILSKGTEADVQDVVTGKTTLTHKAESLIKRVPRVIKSRSRKEKPRATGGGRILRLHNTTPMKVLTREQIDPEFKGTPIEWVDKYGHVQTHTAEQYATMRFGDWVGNARALSKRWRELPAPQNVDHNWLRSPSQRDVTSLTESLEFLRPKIAELEALLACATAALAKKKRTAA
jgi:hypothetical protein